MFRKMGMHHRRMYVHSVYVHTCITSDVASWSPRDALQKRLDTVMQYVCVKPPTSGFVPPFFGHDRQMLRKIPRLFLYYVILSVYISLSRSRTQVSTKSATEAVSEEGRVEIYVTIVPVAPLSRKGDDVMWSWLKVPLIQPGQILLAWKRNIVVELKCTRSNPFASNSSFLIELLIKLN